jgi:hypothetical protein
MKSGIVTVNSPTPALGNRSSVPDVDTIAKMSWDDINELVDSLGAQ